MAVWLRIKYFLIETIMEILTLSGLKTGIQAVPLSQAVFLSFSAVSMSGALVVLEFILVRLVVFLLVCAGNDWYTGSSFFVQIRLGKRKACSFRWINAFFCSLAFHLILVMFCGIAWIWAALGESLVLSALTGWPGEANRRYYPVLFIIYLLGCLFIS